MVSEEDVASLPCNYGNHILHVNTWDLCSEGVVLRVTVARRQVGHSGRSQACPWAARCTHWALGCGQVSPLLCASAPGGLWDAGAPLDSCMGFNELL